MSRTPSLLQITEQQLSYAREQIPVKTVNLVVEIALNLVKQDLDRDSIMHALGIPHFTSLEWAELKGSRPFRDRERISSTYILTGTQASCLKI